MAPRWPAYLVLLGTFVIWSNSFLAARLLVGEQVPAAERLEPLAFVVARFLPVLLVTWPWLLASRPRRREVARLLREHGGLILLLGALSIWTYNLPFAFGQRLVPPGAASLIITLNPVLTFVLAVLLRQERFSTSRAIGLALAFAGVWQVVVYGAGRDLHGAFVTAALVLTLSPLSWSLYTVGAKRLLGDAGNGGDADGGGGGDIGSGSGPSPVVVTYLTLAIGALPTLPLAFAHRGLRAAVAHWTAERWVAALFLGLACTLLGYTLWNFALKRLPATHVTAFVFLNPPLALLFEWLWFGSVPSWGLLLGGAFVLVGVYLCIGDFRRAPRIDAAAAAQARVAPPVLE
ncbi:MAG TPA: EamA family transporter [Thermoanaerobaculia bacterium]|nr:EamA family transporter [Thermoanaerobaculia bacterium]